MNQGKPFLILERLRGQTSFEGLDVAVKALRKMLSQYERNSSDDCRRGDDYRDEFLP
jgi:hypothetical protein